MKEIGKLSTILPHKLINYYDKRDAFPSTSTGSELLFDRRTLPLISFPS